MKKTEKRTGKRLLAVLLAFVMTAGSLGFIPGARAEAAEEEVAYEIYPVPHEMNYGEGEDWIIRGKVNVVYDSAIDNATKNRLEEMLASKGKEVSVSAEKAENATNILVGIYGSGEYAGSYIKETYSPEDELFSHYGGHYVRSSKDEICVLGN